MSRVGWVFIERVFGGRDRRGELRRGMVATLERLRAAAEADGTKRRGQGVQPTTQPGMP